jgi:phage shock protein PspC (stress-responsive transcriptional regulator)
MSTLTRSRNDRWIAGVCGGLARRVGIPSSVMRLIFVVSCILPGPQFLLYLILWVVIPEDNSV